MKRTDSGNGSDDYSDQNNKDKHNNRRGSEANREKKKSGFINFSAAKEREKSKQSASMIRLTFLKFSTKLRNQIK